MFLDDRSRCPSVRFLKQKDSAKDYVTYLKTHSMHPNAIRCDQGTEFLNDELSKWLTEQGIELQLSAVASTFLLLFSAVCCRYLFGHEVNSNRSDHMNGVQSV
jgi:hypothetical protein